MDRTERLVGLLAGLVDARRAVPFSEIQSWFPEDYQQPAREAALRKFERDKEDLLGLGVPLEYLEPSDDSEGGYRVRPEQLFLPPLSLSPDEAAAVYLAGLALLGGPGFPYRGPLATALRKIELASDRPAPLAEPGLSHRVLIDPPAPGADAALESRLQALGQALDARKQVTLSYRALSTGEETRRTVDPLGLFCRRGHWFLVGHCHLRQAVRTFFVHRIGELAINRRRPATPDFEVPAGFRLDDYVNVPPWRYEVHEPLEVVLAADPDFAWLVAEELRSEPLPESAGLPGAPAGSRRRRFAIPVTNLDALVGWVLGMGAKVQVVAPESARLAWRQQLEAVIAAHQAP